MKRRNGNGQAMTEYVILTIGVILAVVFGMRGWLGRTFQARIATFGRGLNSITGSIPVGPGEDPIPLPVAYQFDSGVDMSTTHESANESYTRNEVAGGQLNLTGYSNTNTTTGTRKTGIEKDAGKDWFIEGGGGDGGGGGKGGGGKR